MGTRKKALDELEKFFLKNFVEDKVQGTKFDKDVLCVLDQLREKYAIDPKDDDTPTDLKDLA